MEIADLVKWLADHDLAIYLKAEMVMVNSDGEAVIRDGKMLSGGYDLIPLDAEKVLAAYLKDKAPNQNR